ncbi:hypothetical protein HMPREF1394_01553 [Helicobacter pylori GAM105Ai]|nr:hypothetical protein HMPREF1394_01553 [Helicobacter pylori GAM105Ai]
MAQLQRIGLEIPKAMDLTQEHLTKVMIKFKEQEIYKNVHIIRDFIAPNRESFLTTAYAKSYYKNIK